MEGCVGEKVVLLLGEERPVGRVEHIDYQVQTVHWRPAVEKKNEFYHYTRDLPGKCPGHFFGILDFLPIGNTFKMLSK